MKWLFISFISLLSCTSAKEEKIVLPRHFPKPNYELDIDLQKFELGKQLFFDPIFSKDSTISCASCHQQSFAFADSRPFSIGVRQQKGKRNAPPLQNLLWSNTFFWDGGVHNIELIPLNPITNEKELDETMLNIASKINRNNRYRDFAKKIYLADTFTTYQLLEVLTHYQAGLISDHSRFDDYLRGNIQLTSLENEGYALFQKKCGHCHQGPLQSDYRYRNNGVYKTGDKDLGRYEISLIASDIGKFKTPSLRNIALTAPYMHNSSLSSLEEVLDHYESGIHHSETLDSSLRRNIIFRPDEKTKIIAFLRTLTDTSFIRNTRFNK